MAAVIVFTWKFISYYFHRTVWRNCHDTAKHCSGLENNMDLFVINKKRNQEFWQEFWPSEKGPRRSPKMTSRKMYSYRNDRERREGWWRAYNALELARIKAKNRGRWHVIYHCLWCYTIAELKRGYNSAWEEIIASTRQWIIRFLSNLNDQKLLTKESLILFKLIALSTSNLNRSFTNFLLYIKITVM